MLVLASNSPRRRQLLALGGWSFMLMPVELDERPLPGENPKAYVLRLAEAKARAASSSAAPDAVIVAADTTVVDGLEILGKPVDHVQAEAMLRSLRGRSHQVYTALAVWRNSDGTLLTDCCSTDVPMRDYSDQEMLSYIASGDPMDKAGAYAIQHQGFHPVEGLWGCYANVMGLPLCHLLRNLNKLGISSDVDLPQACQSALEYNCPVFAQIIGGEIEC
jgi:MAF protein